MARQITVTGAAISAELALVGALARAAAQRLGSAIAEGTQNLFNPYRPELHYMRGPGPKWRKKHGLPARKR